MWVQIAERQGGSENFSLFQDAGLGERSLWAESTKIHHLNRELDTSESSAGMPRMRSALCSEDRGMHRIVAHRGLSWKTHLKTYALILLAGQLHRPTKGPCHQVHDNT